MIQINFNSDNISNLREYLHDEEDISYQDFADILHKSSEIYQRCLTPGQLGSTQGLIYGHIQSGKTAVILTTMALAADNGYKNFIVMTSNLNDIYNQTLDRIKRSLDGFQVFGKQEFQHNTGASIGVPLVLVSSKHPGTLRRASSIVQQLNWQQESVMIVDDEADQASLDTNINNQNKPTSPVNQEIVNLRQHLDSHAYLQTTATPQALLLQDGQSAFRPDFVVTTKEGTGYVGGNYFFGNDNFQNSDHIRIVPDIDVTSNQIPDTVKQSILLFFLGAAILRIQGRRKNYTYLLHTSFKQIDHSLATHLVDQYKNELVNQLKLAIKNSVNSMLPQFRIGLQNAYSDLQQTFNQIPAFDDVISEIARVIASTEVIEINANTGVGISPDPSRKHTLYIGGTKIGRGVTVKNLLVTYYGRDAQNPQIDTVLQHARMYGYRQGERPAIRIYLPQHLAVRFFDIHTIDNLMREKCQFTHQAIPVIPLINRRLKPTRRNVLNENTVELGTYLGGKKYFPHLPISAPSLLGNQTKILDDYLCVTKYPHLQHPYQITIDEILHILSFQFATPLYSDNWKDELIRQSLSAIKSRPQYNNRGTLVIVNRTGNLKKAEVGSIQNWVASCLETSLIRLMEFLPTILYY